MSANKVKLTKLTTLWKRNMRVLKVVCPECGEKAIIRKTNRKHRDISDIYCACSDVECGHTFVLNLTFSHTISPSAKTGDKLIQTLLRNLNPDQRQMALELLNAPATV